jgi:hypothetical protein
LSWSLDASSSGTVSGKLVHLDPQVIAREAAAANVTLRKRAGWW